MIKELHLQNFKRFRDQTFRFRPAEVSLLAGGNNCGKSTVLQALAVWEFCRTVIETNRGRAALVGPYTGDGIGVSTEDFSPLALPRFDHLWTNLRPRDGYHAGQPNAAYTMRIDCKWDEVAADGAVSERELQFGLNLAHDRVYVKPLRSTVAAGGVIPRCAYLPTFAGITAREERLSPAAQRRLIGRGLAGAVLRNIVFDLHQRSVEAWNRALAGRRTLLGEERRQFYMTDPWHQLRDVLERVFRCALVVGAFDELYHTTVGVEVFRGDYQGGQFTRFPRYTPRDIMVEGSGFLQWLSVYALAVNREIDVLLLDEPDAHLHPSLQDHLLTRLRSLARENNKQVLLATHSTEILRRVEPEEIYGIQEGRIAYLTTDNQRVGLFEGLGSEYCPKLDQLRLHRRVVFYEGTFDEAIFRILSTTLGQPLPNNLVFWFFTGKHSQRKVLFNQLRELIPELRGISIRDRDSLELGDVGPNLTEHNYPDAEGNGLLCRTLRRRHLDSYLLVPPAIARAAGRAEAEVTQFLTDTWGLGVGANFTASDCAPGLLDARGKEILYEGLPARNGEPARPSLQTHYGCSRHDIAQQMLAAEIPEDIRRLIEQINQVSQP